MKNLPLGSRYILWMDMAAQYSFYGMNAILPLFLLVNIQMTEVKIVALMQMFLSWRYMAMIGTTILSETILTQKTLMILASVISIFGHVFLSYDTTVYNVYFGLALIAVGIGIIKICIQPLIVYQTSNDERLSAQSLSWLYVFTNIGTISIIITPWVLANFGYRLAFLSPTILVIISTIILIAGSKYIKNPPLKRAKKFITLEQLKGLKKWIPLILVVCIFEAFFVQMYSSWVVQGNKMDGVIFGLQISPVQLQILDTIFIITLVPLIAMTILPFLQKKWNFLVSVSSQLSFGFLCGFLSFLIITVLQVMIERGFSLNLSLQIPAFFFLAMGEIMILCIGKNILYAKGQEDLRVKIALLYAIFSLIVNSLASFALSFFAEIDVKFFACCTVVLFTMSVLLQFFIVLRKRKIILDKTKMLI